MVETVSERGVQKLIDEARSRLAAGRYHDALRVAEQAVEAARRLDLTGLELVALFEEADALRMLGDDAAALARYSRIVTAAHDPTLGDVLARDDVVRAIVQAHMDCVVCGRFLPQLGRAQLLEVLDRGEAYLRAIGRTAWRAGFCSERARVLQGLGRTDEAVGHAEEAVALAERHPDAPGYTLAAYRWSLGDLLREVGRHEDARHHYQRVLDDRASGSHGRKVALEGLARCALATDDATSARRHAQQAVQEAELLGDNSLCPALEALTDACLAQPDHDAAWATAQRHLDIARRLGSPHHLYFAVQDAANVALARRDAAAASPLLDELQPLAEQMDRSTGRTIHMDTFRWYRKRLAELHPEPNA